jgi:hypothetical protein
MNKIEDITTTKTDAGSPARYSSIATYISPADLLHQTVIVGALGVMLAMAGCAESPPATSNGTALTAVEMAAARGDPFFIPRLTPMQQQRVIAYRNTHPDVTSSFAQDTVPVLMGAGAGYMLGNTPAAARPGPAAGTAATTAETDGAVSSAGRAIRTLPEVEIAIAPESEVAISRAIAVPARAAAGEELGGLFRAIVTFEERCFFLCW